MTIKSSIVAISASLIALTCELGFAIEPSNPNATPEAKALIELFHAVSSKYTLTGQHNFPNARDRNSRFYAREVGKTPAIWSSDFGYAKDGDKDSYLARPSEPYRKYTHYNPGDEYLDILALDFSGRWLKNKYRSTTSGRMKGLS
jgi:hypothetical protein